MSDRRGSGLVGIVVALAVLAGACDDGDGDGGKGDGGGGYPSGSATSAAAGRPPEVETFPVPSKSHVQGPVSYPQTPPVGGDHNGVWQNCGFYANPVAPERAVHSMEHGAVWVTYRPNLARDQVDRLRQLSRSRAYVLVSPWSNGSLPAPFVASAWGVQLKVTSAAAPALAEFVNTYAGRGNAPEPGAPCTGAFGTPE